MHISDYVKHTLTIGGLEMSTMAQPQFVGLRGQVVRTTQQYLVKQGHTKENQANGSGKNLKRI